MIGQERAAGPPIDAGKRWYSVAHALFVVLCFGAGYVAHLNSRPVTSALALIFAVVLVATRYGLRAGLAAGVVVSLAYNLLFSDPFLGFGLQDLDDLIPLLAFNLSAFASAYVAGRLRDEARLSREAHSRLDALLNFSEQLQKAVDLKEMVRAARHSGEVQAVELHLNDGRTFAPDTQFDLTHVAEHFRDRGGAEIPAPEQRLYISEQFNGGQLVALAMRKAAPDVRARMAILAIAAERWLLTERLVEADVIRRSEDFKTTLLSSVSHDLRTPLAIISACAGSLLRYPEGLTDEARRDLLQSIEQQSARLNHLTGNLLSLGRIEGGLDLERMPHIDALEVLGSALVTLRQLAPDRVITKELGLAEAIVKADPSMLEQVFINVLQNAVIHTPSKTPIHVGVLRGSNEVVIAVDDQGPGIAPEQSERIFERFQQAPSPGQRSTGSGLGLSIARGFARAVGGDVRVGRRPSGASGARFEICLPMASQEAVD